MNAEIEELITKIKLTKFKLKDIIGTNVNMAKVIVMGITGCGKSSLTSCLTNQEVLVKEGAGKKTRLEGTGIGSGFESFTKEPKVIIDHVSNIMYCDCPGFEDTDEFNQEVVNSFVIDYLFDISRCSKLKILLVISDSEIDASRGQAIKNCLVRMNKMFPKPGELERGIGLVITKGDPELTTVDYIEQLEDNCNDDVKEWCNFFKNNLDRVFVFPQASKKDINKPYNFNDYFRLKKFLTSNYLIDPVHKIALSDIAKEHMINIGIGLSKKVSDVVTWIFLKITDNYLTDKKSFYLKKWLSWMNGLKDRNIKNAEELNQFIHTYFPGNGRYNYYLGCLSDTEIINGFILKVLGINYCNNALEKSVLTLTSRAIEELEALYNKARTCETIEARRIEFERMLEMKRRQIEEQKRQEQLLQIEIDKKRIQIEQQRIQQENLRRQIRH